MRLSSTLLATLVMAFSILCAEPEISPDFLKTKYGFFVHYVWAGRGGGLTIDRHGKQPENFDAFADAFDVDSPDGSITYLHILNPPAAKQVRIGMPASGARFGKATLLTSGKPVALEMDKAGYLLTLPDDESWNPLHTAIRMERK